MLLAEQFISSLVKIHGHQHPVSTDGGTWYPQACRFLRLPHHIHSSYEKSIIERTIQYMIKDRTECFDDYYFPCRKKNCKLLHVWNWLNLFVGYHNKQLQIVKWTEPRQSRIYLIIRVHDSRNHFLINPSKLCKSIQNIPIRRIKMPYLILQYWWLLLNRVPKLHL